MNIPSRICQQLAICVCFLLACGTASATDYITTLTLEAPPPPPIFDEVPEEVPESEPFVEQVVIRWSWEPAAEGGGELTNYSLELFTAQEDGDCVARNSNCEQTYYDQIISKGVIRPLPGVTRTSNDPSWDFDFDTLTLRQFRNMDYPTIAASSGRQVLVSDGVTLPQDGIVRLDTYENGSETNVTITLLESQQTVIDTTGTGIAVAPACCTTLSFSASLTHGWQFTPTRDILITSLGWSDPGQDGFVNGSHPVGLYRQDGTSALRTATVTSSSRLRDGYRYADIQPIILSAGTTYIVAGYDAGGEAGGDRYALAPIADTVISNAFNYEGYVSAVSGSLQKPTSSPTPEVACCARWAVNFEFEDAPRNAWTGGLLSPQPPGARGPVGISLVSEDGTNGPAIFRYDNQAPGSGGSGAARAWEFFTTAAADGDLTLDYEYSGFHAFFSVTVGLDLFILSDGSTTTIPLVNAGPASCCTTPSAGFSYSGSTSFTVSEGDIYGFRMRGGNGDSNSRLRATLSVNLDEVLTVANPVDDIVANEDGGDITVDFSSTFDPPTGLTYVTSNNNPGLFSSEVINGSILTLTPAVDQFGSAVITVEATNSSGASAQDTFVVDIVPVNDPPVSTGPLPDIELVLGEDMPSVDLVAQFDDVDIDTEGDSLEYSASSSTPGVVSLSVEEGFLEIEGIGVGTTTITVEATDLAGASASESFLVTTTDPEFLGTAVLIQAVGGIDPNTGDNLTAVAISATGLPGTSTQTVELLTANSCSDGSLGEDAVVFAEVVIPEFDSNGEAYLTSLIPTPGPIGTYATARIRGSFSSGDVDSCIVAGPDNDSWIRALELPLTVNGEVSTAAISGFVDREGNARWFKFQIQPGSKVSVDLSSLPKDYDLFLFKDIAAVFEELEGDNDVDGLNRLGAEFAPSIFAPSQFAPSIFAPSQFAPDAYAPSQFAPSQFAPSIFAPSIFAPSIFAPSQFAPSIFAPSQFAPSQFAPSQFAPSQFAPSQFAPSQFASENFASAQIRSLIGVSATPGTGSEQTVADTWNNTGAFYVRVSGKNGAFDVESPFQLDIEVDGVDCTGVTPASETITAEAGGYRSIILWDSVRVANDPNNTPSEAAALEANLQALASRPEVNGVLLDLAGLPTIQSLHDQADSFTSCPYAENLTAQAIKEVVDAYRDANPGMEYVVLVGSDSHIPFFRYPDQGLLGPEQDYNPPVADGTQSQSALRLNYILGQDEYGAAVRLSLRDGDFPIPGLAVGRLVETAADMNTVLDAYLATSAGVIDAPASTLVTGYDFLTDAADAVQFELVAGTGGVRNDTLITASDISPDDPRSWTADDLRRELLDEGEDIVFLAGHFSANSALAADYKTTTLTTELESATTEFTNAIVFSAGCHSGYNIVNEDVVPGVTQPLDWTQAFAAKGATLIAGTGYQYGDTDFVEYGERLYVGFAQQLRTGLGPVSVGNAMVAAKQNYLETTPDIRGLHRKSIIISTIFGLPMLSVDMPGERIIEDVDVPTIQPQLVQNPNPNDPVVLPGTILGLHVADLLLDFTDGNDGAPVENTVALAGLDGSSQTATFYEGPNGVVSNPAEPALPLYTRNVTPILNDPQNLLSLRGVGFRGGSWSESVILPLTGAPTTELRGVHTPFTSPVYFPMKLANSNYFDALTGGGTTLLHVTPAQHKSDEVGDINSILRLFGSLDFRLYYSGNTVTYDQNQPALAGPPTMSGVDAVIDGSDIVFSVNVVGDASAAIHEVWVTHTVSSGASGEWMPLDLEQDDADSTLWTGRLVGAVGPPRDYVVQAVSGMGLVTIDDNFGAFYSIPGVLPGEPPPEEVEPAPTELALYAPWSGAYGDNVEVSANLSAELFPVEGANIVFTLGGAARVGKTDMNGDVTVELPLTAPPGDYVVTASYAGNDELEPSDADAPLTITRTNTLLTLLFGDQAIGVEGIDSGVSAMLMDESDRPILQRTVYFTLIGGVVGQQTFAVITDNTGVARLGALPLPGGDYDLSVRFLGDIPTEEGMLMLTDPIYEPSIASDILLLDDGPDCPPPSGKSKGKKSKGKGSKHRDDDDDDDDDDRRKRRIHGFCYVDRDVDEDIDIRNGTLIIGEGVEVRKKIDQRGPGSVIVLESAVVKKKITERDEGDVIIYGTARDRIKEEDAGDVYVGETAYVRKKVEEKQDGSITVSGLVDDDVKEKDAGDLIVTPTGVIDGTAEEKGEGQLINDGSIKRIKSDRGRRGDDDDDDDDDDDEDDDD